MSNALFHIENSESWILANPSEVWVIVEIYSILKLDQRHVRDYWCLFLIKTSESKNLHSTFIKSIFCHLGEIRPEQDLLWFSFLMVIKTI